MPDDISRIIYKTELDPEGYIRGVEALAASTKKLNEAQEATNKTLQTNEAALKANSERLAKAKKDLEDYTGTNARYRKQLEGDIKNAEKEQVKLTQLVNENKTAYDAAAKAAQNFANITAKAGTIQGIGTAPIVPPVAQKINATQLTDLPDIVNATKGEFDALRVAIGLADERLQGLDESSEEFKQLAPIVQQGKLAIQQYDDATKKTTGSQVSLRTQLRLGREELVKLEQAGQGASKEYLELEKRVAKLTDEFGDQQARIKILASDTKLLDFGKGAITAATSAFQTYASVSILAGDESEELQKKTMQLFAAMQLLQSLEQLSNLTRREGILSTLALSGAQSVYTAVVGASSGALKAFRLALLGTGIGAAVIAIGFLVVKYKEWAAATKEANAQQKLLRDIQDKAIDSYAEEVTKLEILRLKLNDLTLSQKDRIAFAKEYNKTAEEGNKIDLKQIENIDLVNAAITRKREKRKERALAQAAANVTTEKASELFKAEAKLAESAPDFKLDLNNIEKQIADAQKQVIANLRSRSRDYAKEFRDIAIRDALIDIKAANEEFSRAASLTATLTATDTVKPKPAPGITKAIESDFQQRKAVLLEQIAKLANDEFETEVKIRREYAAKLEKAIQDINRDKSLKPAERKELISLATTLNTGELDKAIADYNKKVTDTRKKLNDELNDIQDKYILENLNLINEEFERRAAIIDFNEKKAIADAKENTQERLDSLELDRFLLGEQNYQDARAEIVGAGEQAVLNITQRGANERQKLAADIFKNSLDLTNQIFEDQLLQLDENTAEKIQQQKALLSQGTINYDEFQKRITKILKDEKTQRDKIRLNELNAELKAINDRIKAVTNAEEKAELQKRQRAVRGQIAEINRQTNDVVDPNSKKVDTLQAYVTSIGQLADSVVAFWQKANDAEAAALDRSISLQEKRVSAAQRIAERGNASYLKAEEDRLNELTVKRENAARKQLGIDAALQASQILVGITGAISKIATPGIGIAETIGAMAVIFSSLAAGYGLVKSLQGNQPKLFKGTRYLKRNGEPAGRDTIPAMLNEGEAVIPTETNKAYHPTVAAIYDGTIPPEHINNFVKNYHKIKSIPQPDYGRIKDTAELKMNADGKMAVAISEQNKLIMENNDLQRQTLRAMSKLSISANIDRDGVAIMVNEYMQQQIIDRKV
jgi:hypothetical protein